MAFIMYYRTRIDFIIVKNVVDVKNTLKQVILIQNPSTIRPWLRQSLVYKRWMLFSTMFRLYRGIHLFGRRNRITRSKPLSCFKSITTFNRKCCIEYTSTWMAMKRKFKDGWSTIPPISTKQTTTSYLKSLPTQH